jgi:ATP-binding cassette subfamily F protein 3
LKIGVVAQHQIDILSLYLYETPVTYIGNLMGLSATMKEAEIRSHLGAFGLGGSVALQKIGSLSGGQKARLSFAAVCASRPHLLFLDEPTNHLSIEAIDNLIQACQDFTGGIVIVSHNKYFLANVCEELFVVSNQGTFSVRKPLPDASVSTSGSSGGGGGGGGDGSDSDDENHKKNSAFVELLERCIQEQMRG